MDGAGRPATHAPRLFPGHCWRAHLQTKQTPPPFTWAVLLATLWLAAFTLYSVFPTHVWRGCARVVCAWARGVRFSCTPTGDALPTAIKTKMAADKLRCGAHKPSVTYTHPTTATCPHTWLLAALPLACWLILPFLSLPSFAFTCPTTTHALPFQHHLPHLLQAAFPAAAGMHARSMAGFCCALAAAAPGFHCCACWHALRSCLYLSLYLLLLYLLSLSMLPPFSPYLQAL